MIKLMEPFQSGIQLHIETGFLQNLWDKYVPVSSEEYDRISLIYLKGASDIQAEPKRQIQLLVNLILKNVFVQMNLQQNSMLFNRTSVNHSLSYTMEHYFQQLKRLDFSVYQSLHQFVSGLEQAKEEDVRYKAWQKENQVIAQMQKEYRILQEFFLRLKELDQEYSVKIEKRLERALFKTFGKKEYKVLTESLIWAEKERVEEYIQHCSEQQYQIILERLKKEKDLYAVLKKTVKREKSKEWSQNRSKEYAEENAAGYRLEESESDVIGRMIEKKHAAEPDVSENVHPITEYDVPKRVHAAEDDAPERVYTTKHDIPESVYAAEYGMSEIVYAAKHDMPEKVYSAEQDEPEKVYLTGQDVLNKAYPAEYDIPEKVYLTEHDMPEKVHLTKYNVLEKVYPTKQDEPEKVHLTKHDVLEKAYPTKQDEPEKAYPTKQDEPEKVHLTKQDEPEKVYLTKQDEPEKVYLTKQDEPEKVYLAEHDALGKEYLTERNMQKEEHRTEHHILEKEYTAGKDREKSESLSLFSEESGEAEEHATEDRAYREISEQIWKAQNVSWRENVWNTVHLENAVHVLPRERLLKFLYTLKRKEFRKFYQKVLFSEKEIRENRNELRWTGIIWTKTKKELYRELERMKKEDVHLFWKELFGMTEKISSVQENVKASSDIEKLSKKKQIRFRTYEKLSVYLEEMQKRYETEITEYIRNKVVQTHRQEEYKVIADAVDTRFLLGTDVWKVYKKTADSNTADIIRTEETSAVSAFAIETDEQGRAEKQDIPYRIRQVEKETVDKLQEQKQQIVEKEIRALENYREVMSPAELSRILSPEEVSADILQSTEQQSNPKLLSEILQKKIFRNSVERFHIDSESVPQMGEEAKSEKNSSADRWIQNLKNWSEALLFPKVQSQTRENAAAYSVPGEKKQTGVQERTPSERIQQQIRTAKDRAEFQRLMTWMNQERKERIPVVYREEQLQDPEIQSLLQYVRNLKEEAYLEFAVQLADMMMIYQEAVQEFHSVKFWKSDTRDSDLPENKVHRSTENGLGDKSVHALENGSLKEEQKENEILLHRYEKEHLTEESIRELRKWGAALLLQREKAGKERETEPENELLMELPRETDILSAENLQTEIIRRQIEKAKNRAGLQRLLRQINHHMGEKSVQLIYQEQQLKDRVIQNLLTRLEEMEEDKYRETVRQLSDVLLLLQNRKEQNFHTEQIGEKGSSRPEKEEISLKESHQWTEPSLRHLEFEGQRQQAEANRKMIHRIREVVEKRIRKPDSEQLDQIFEVYPKLTRRIQTYEEQRQKSNEMKMRRFEKTYGYAAETIHRLDRSRQQKISGTEMEILQKTLELRPPAALQYALPKEGQRDGRQRSKIQASEEAVQMKSLQRQMDVRLKEVERQIQKAPPHADLDGEVRSIAEKVKKQLHEELHIERLRRGMI